MWPGPSWTSWPLCIPEPDPGRPGRLGSGRVAHRAPPLAAGQRGQAARAAAAAQRLHRRWGAGGFGHPLAGRASNRVGPAEPARERGAGPAGLGQANSEIAAALGISVHTIERHVANVFAKLSVRNRAEATALPSPRGDRLKLHSFRDVRRRGWMRASRETSIHWEGIMTDAKITTIQNIYEAFGRGDIGFILDQLTDDVDWASCPDSEIAPWHGVPGARPRDPTSSSRPARPSRSPSSRRCRSPPTTPTSWW